MKGWKPKIAEAVVFEDLVIDEPDEREVLKYWTPLTEPERKWTVDCAQQVFDLLQPDKWSAGHRKFWKRIRLGACPSVAAATFVVAWLRECPTFSHAQLIQDGGIHGHPAEFIVSVTWPPDWL